MDITTNVKYDKYVDQWSRIRDVLDGSDAIKGKAETYLPRLQGQTDSEYRAYKLRASFFNMSSRVFSANIGMITRRTPTLDFPKAMASYLEDTSSFMSFYELFVSLSKELLAVGSAGVLIDINDDIPTPIMYRCESILDWTHKNRELTSLILAESTYEGDSYIDTYYHLYISDKGIYTVDTYKEGNEDPVQVVPKYKGMALDFIPFVGVNTLGIDMTPVKSPILDIIDMNLSHYLTSADYEHGLHFVALPTPVFSGVTFDSAVKLGSSEGIVLPSKDAKAYYLEFQGQGLDSLRKALQDKQSQISLFSARLQDTNTKGSEAENTVRLRYAADSASLTDIAVSTELALQKTYEYIAIWLDVDPDAIDINLNKDFLSTKLTPNELKELAKAYVDGAMDIETYVYNLERGEMVKPGHLVSLPTQVKKEEPRTDEPPNVEQDQE